MKSIVLLLSFWIGLIPTLAKALTPGAHCLVKPSQIENLTNKMLLAHQEEKKVFPDSSVIQFEAMGDINSEGSQHQEGTFEGIFRPEEDGYFSLTPLPILVVELKRTRELFYICAHSSSENPQENYMILYFLRGYSMGPTTVGSFIGDLLFNSVKVKPVSLTPFGMSGIRKLFSSRNGFNPLGIFLIPIELTDSLQRTLMGTISTFSKVGVERIILTTDNLELASGVDLKNPKKALFKNNISLRPKMPNNPAPSKGKKRSPLSHFEILRLEHSYSPQI